MVRAFPARLLTRLVARLQRVTLWQWALVAAIAGYTSYFTNLTLDVHHGLGTSAYDYGLYDQGVWLMSRFRAPFVTLMGRNLMGDHTSFILVLLVPIYWLFPSAGALFFTQALAIALGAPPLITGEALGSTANTFSAGHIALSSLAQPSVTLIGQPRPHRPRPLQPLLLFLSTSGWRPSLRPPRMSTPLFLLINFVGTS